MRARLGAAIGRSLVGLTGRRVPFRVQHVPAAASPRRRYGLGIAEAELSSDGRR